VRYPPIWRQFWVDWLTVPARNMEPSERRVSGSSAGTERPQLVVSGFGYLDVSALVRPLPCRVVRGESDERDPGCAGADRGDGDGPGPGRGRLLTARRLRRPGTSRARYRCGAGRPLRGLAAMSLLIVGTGLAGVPGDAVGGGPGGVGGAGRPGFPGSPCFSAPPRSRASPRPSRSGGQCGSGRRLRAVPRGRPATGGRAAAGTSWAAATGAGLAKAAVRLAFIWPASAGEYGGGQPIGTVRPCRKDHPAARCITGLVSLSLRPGTTGSEGGGAGPLG
jgi:hypothetical protein